MTITTGIPSNIRAPRTFHSFLYATGNRSLIPSDKRVALLGIMSSAGTMAVATPTEVFDSVTTDGLAGVGSELALMARAAFAQFAKEGKSCRLFLVGLAETTTARVGTLTLAGTATESGTLLYRIAGRPIAVGVTSGDTANTVSAAFLAAINAAGPILPITATNAAPVVTWTCRYKGSNGADIAFRQESGIAGITVAFAQTVAGVGATDLTAVLATLAGQRYDGIATANHAANDVSDLLAHLDVCLTATAKKWRRAFLCENGSIGTATTHAGSFNSVGAHVLVCEGVESLPGEIASAMAVAFNVATRPNANLNGHELVGYPPIASNAFDDTEIETALSVGASPLVPVIGGSGSQVDGKLKLVKLTTTKTLDGATPVEWPRLPAVSQVGWAIAEQLDYKFAERFGASSNPEGALIDGQVKDRVRDLVVDVLYSAEEANWIRNVDDVLPSIVVEIDGSVADRVNTALEYIPVVPFSQAAFMHRVSQSLSLGR